MGDGKHFKSARVRVGQVEMPGWNSLGICVLICKKGRIVLGTWHPKVLSYDCHQSLQLWPPGTSLRVALPSCPEPTLFLYGRQSPGWACPLVAQGRLSAYKFLGSITDITKTKNQKQYRPNPFLPPTFQPWTP